MKIKKYSKYLFIVLTVFIMSFATLIPAKAADSTEPTSPDVPLSENQQSDLYDNDKPAEIKDTSGLTAEFVQNTQDPRTKIIKFEMILHANVDSDRVKVTWTVAGSSEEVNKSQMERTFTVEKGKTYSIPFEVKPTGTGVTEIYGTAQAFLVDSNLLVTVRKDYASKDSEILPITSEYKTAKTKYLLIMAALILLGLTALFVVGFFGIKAFIKWYDAEDRK